jgi:glutamate carboxypeptidase
MLLDRLAGVFPLTETSRQEDVGNHYVLRTGTDSGGIYILGHMDTVFPPTDAFQECMVDGEWLRGPGSGDMKGGLAVIVYALKSLHDAGIFTRMNVNLILSADEEIGAVTSRPIYEKECLNAAACLVAECAGPSGEVVLSRNGKAGLRVDCSGEYRHVARVTGKKRSAILEMAHKVVALEELNTTLPGVSVNVGKIEGGLGPCTVPAKASCFVDMRWVEERYYETGVERIRDIVADPVCPGCTCTVTVLNHRPAMPLTDETETLYRTLTEVATSAGMTISSEHRRGTSDANFFGSAGVPTIDGLGPVCLDDHTPDERIHTPSLSARTTLLALLIAGLAWD